MSDRALVATTLASIAAAALCAAAWFLRNRRDDSCSEEARTKRALEILREFQDRCWTSTDRLRSIADAMVDEMKAGLANERSSRLKMLVSFVDTLPTGDEKGLYYALDLGGTNFRALRVKLGGKEGRVVHQEYNEVSIPLHLMTGTTEELFGFIASELAKFVATESEELCVYPGQQRKLGFTFSFPVNQHTISSGSLIKWTKGFAVSGTVDKDVSEILDQAMEKEGLNMRVVALINDTVGTLAGGRYWDEDVKMAVILGTGSNACYEEEIVEIPKLKGENTKSDKMVINMEWGNFWTPLLPMTDIDKTFDSESLNPGEQMFEKLISGMYLGEIVRRLLLQIAEETGLFGDTIAENLETPYRLRSPDVSVIHGDKTSDLQVTARILKDTLGVTETSLSTRKLVVEACRIVAERGARLAAAGIVAILKKIGRDVDGPNGKRTVVAMDGGLYEHYPQFREYLQNAVTELVGKKVSERVIIELSKDGSGIGAALLAASHSVYTQC